MSSKNVNTANPQTTNQEMIRCFIGIFFDKKTLQKINKTIHALKHAYDSRDIRWIPLDHIHVTLRFLGPTSTALIPSLCQELSLLAQQISPFHLTLSHIIHFSSARNNILALNIDHSEPLINLVKCLEREVNIIGFPKERRSFLGHITLARIKQRKHHEIPSLPSLCLKVPIYEFSLVRSQTLSTGVNYTKMATFVFTPEDDRITI